MSGRSENTLALLRRWVVDYFNSHDPAACADFVAPDYRLHIGDTLFAGRDTEWLPAVDTQMALFPGLGMTVHRTLCGPGWAGVYFSEHGATEGGAAVWSGIAIYRSDGTRLTSCVAQEDYMTRQRQLKNGTVDPVEPPAVAPWDSKACAPDPAAQTAVRDWLQTGWPLTDASIRVDDEHITGTFLAFDTAVAEIDIIHSSGPEVVFHAVQHGIYQGGLPKVEKTGQAAHLHVNGMLRFENGKLSGRIIRDRGALQAILRRGGGQ